MDVELMGDAYGFSVDQLMELAGLSCASAIVDAAFHFPGPTVAKPTVLVIAGPGNNGGDGLVAARHLHHMGFTPTVLYPKHKNVDIYNRLVLQLQKLSIAFTEDYSPNTYDLIVDAIFGYSFQGEIRAPFRVIINELAKETRAKIVSLDVPSGWHVENGDILNTGLNPDMLISLTAPKLCSADYTGLHYLGGRFVPDEMSRRYGLDTLPAYEGSLQYVKLS